MTLFGRWRERREQRKIVSAYNTLVSAEREFRNLRVTASRNLGRSVKRDGGERKGSLKSWTVSTVERSVGERQKADISERGRDLVVNDPTAAGIGKLPEEVVNIGITPQPAPMTKFLGRDHEWESEYQSTVSDYFTLWGLSPHNFCDATGRQNFYMMQQIALFGWRIDGISLFQRVHKDQKGRPLSLAWLPIDSYRLKSPVGLGMKKDIYDGIELDKYGHPVTAYILRDTSRPATDGNLEKVPVYDKETGLPNLLIVCDVRFISEYRQDSMLGPIIKTLRDKGDTVSAALIKTLLQNLWVAAATPPEGGVGYGANFYNNLVSLDWKNRINFLTEGTILQALPGEKLDFLHSQSPGPNFRGMIETSLEEVGMGTGRGYEHTIKRYQSSYSASRAAMLISNMFNESDRMVLNNRLNDPAMSWFQVELALLGKSPVSWAEIKKLIEDGELSALTNTEWLPPPTYPIDPLKEANADVKRQDARLETRREYWGKRSKGWKDQFRQFYVEEAENRKLADEFGFDLGIGQPQTTQVDEPEDQERDEEEKDVVVPQRTPEE